MQVLRFLPGQAAQVSTRIDGESLDGGFYWLDLERSEADWHSAAQPWLGASLDERHVRDTLNDSHPPYYDGAEDYDLLVVRALCPDCPPEAPTTRAVALIVTKSAVVTIRPEGDPLFGKLCQRFLASHRRIPTSPEMLVYQLLDSIIDALLTRRDVSSDLLSGWQERLLDRNDQFNDWRALMRLRGQLRRLEVLTEGQMDALDKWREQTVLAVDVTLNVRFNDLQEHLRRVYNHALVMQQDIDALVQIYFSSNTQRANEILQFLTIISAVFLPLNLLAGLFGMNFAHMPLLQAAYGPAWLGGFMLILVAGLLLWFRHRHWL